MKAIDLRSDTVTQPSPAMRKAMADAVVGDDVYGEDPTVTQLEERAANLVGKQAGLFVPTGTMGNQIAVKVWTKPGQRIVVSKDAHIGLYELGAYAVISGVTLTTAVTDESGAIEVSGLLEPAAYSYQSVGLVCQENSHNMAGGRVSSVASMERVQQECAAANIPVHLDGARIFNAAEALGVGAEQLASTCDSVMFCLSKGLAAPVGSMLCGSSEFIAEARRVRKMLGGGMRQAGVLAAAGLIALEVMVHRLKDDHANARFFAKGLREMGYKVSTVDTNILMVSHPKFEAKVLHERFAESDVLCHALSAQKVRFVTHCDVSRDDLKEALGRIRGAFRR